MNVHFEDMITERVSDWGIGGLGRSGERVDGHWLVAKIGVIEVVVVRAMLEGGFVVCHFRGT